MVALNEHGGVVRPAILWNDTRSARAAEDLIVELGQDTWLEATGISPVASITVTKLRWLAENEPGNAARTRLSLFHTIGLLGRFREIVILVGLSRIVQMRQERAIWICEAPNIATICWLIP